MLFNKQKHLTDNIEAIRLILELEKSQQWATPGQQEVLRGYSGFGGLKCILLPCESPEDVRQWSKSEAPLFPAATQLHEVLRKNTENDNLYMQYMESLKSSILTAFYTPPEIARTIASQLAKHGIVPGRFLDPSEGTGVFLSAFMEAGSSENTCFENDLITGKILKELYPRETVHIAVLKQ